MGRIVAFEVAGAGASGLQLEGSRTRGPVDRALTQHVMSGEPALEPPPWNLVFPRGLQYLEIARELGPAWPTSMSSCSARQGTSSKH